MSSIYRRNNTKLIVLILVIIAIVATATYLIMFHEDPSSQEPPVPVVETPTQTTTPSGDSESDISEIFAPVTKKYSILSDYDGYWGDVLQGNVDSGGTDLWIYVNSDDSIDISLSEFQNARFEIEDLKIVDKKGTFENVYGMYSGTIFLKENVIELTYTNGYITTPIDQTFKKISTRTITQKELFDEIDRIIASNFSTIDPTMFSCVETNDFLSLYLVAGCYVKEREYSKLEDSTNFYRDVYLIDKKKAKLITLMELLDNDVQKMEDVDKYIKNYLEVKKLEFNKLMGNTGAETDIKWPFNSFVGINFVNNFVSKNFDVDERNQVVKIKSVTNIRDKKIASSSIWAPVPFELVFDSNRLSSMNISSSSLKQELTDEVARAYLELIISQETGEDLETFGDDDTNRYRFLNVSGEKVARLGIVGQDKVFKSYRYNDETKQVDEVEKIDYSKQAEVFNSLYKSCSNENEIKTIICISSDLQQIDSVIDAISDYTTDEAVSVMIDKLKEKLDQGTLTDEEKEVILKLFEDLKNGE